MSPHELDLDLCLPVEIRSFEWVGSQIAAHGTDLRTGNEVLVFRTWPRETDGSRPNPLIRASERVGEGGVMFFTDVEPFSQFDDDRAIYSSGGFITVANGYSQSASVIDDQPVFIDPPETDPKTDRMSQLYNVIETERAQPVSDAHSFFQAMADAYKGIQSNDDSILIRGYSTEDGVASSIRVLIDTSKSFNEAMQDFLAADHFIDMVGTENGTFEVNGENLVGSLEGASDTTHFEVIPVTGHRKGLSPKDPDLRESLQNAGHGLFQSFVYEGANNQFGFRQTTLALRSFPTRGGGTMEDIVGVFHEHAPARPLSLISTANAPDLSAEIPGFAAEPIVYDDSEDDYPEQDFFSVIAEVVEENNRAEGSEESEDPDADFLGEASEPEPDQDVDFLAVIQNDTTASTQPENETDLPQESEADEIDFGIDTFANLEPGQPQEPEASDTPAVPEDMGDEIDLETLGEPQDNDVPAPSASPEENAASDIEGDTIDLDVLDDTSPTQDVEQTPSSDIIDLDDLTDPAESIPTSDPMDDEIDIDALEFDQNYDIAADHDHFVVSDERDEDAYTGPAQVRVQGKSEAKLASGNMVLDQNSPDTVALYEPGLENDFDLGSGVDAFLVKEPEPAPSVPEEQAAEEPVQDVTSLASEEDTSPSSEAAADDEVDLGDLDLDALSSALKF